MSASQDPTIAKHEDAIMNLTKKIWQLPAKSWEEHQNSPNLLMNELTFGA